MEIYAEVEFSILKKIIIELWMKATLIEYFSSEVFFFLLKRVLNCCMTMTDRNQENKYFSCPIT